MEGILGPSNTGFTIPYLAYQIPRLPNDAFYDIPTLPGLEEEYDRMDSAKTASFLQSWLFFELLSEFLEERVDQAHFVVRKTIQIDQDRVSKYFQAWRTKVSLRSVAQRKVTQSNIISLLTFSFWNSEVWEARAKGDTNLMKVTLSIKLLISLLDRISADTFTTLRSPLHEYLATWSPYLFGLKITKEQLSFLKMRKREAKQHFAQESKSYYPLPPGDERGGCATQLLLRIFKANGWCPVQARRICRSYDYLVANQFASLRRPVSQITKQSRCSDLTKCIASDINLDSGDLYSCQHVGHDNCEIVDADRDELMKIINAGGTPIISVDTKSENLDLKLIKRTAWTSYTAVSHVWSDGLGNPVSNSMPCCQIKRLRQMIRENSDQQCSPHFHTVNKMFWSALCFRMNWWRHRDTLPGKPFRAGSGKRVQFWIDTLCIPTISSEDKPDVVERVKELRRRAIQHISSIYAGADDVLVLDQALENSDVGSHPVSPDTFAAQILASAWMQRGWTLEEGSLAQSCIFRLGGKPYDLATMTDVIVRFNGSERLLSPLQRASCEIERGLPMVLAKALADEKRKLSTALPADRKTSMLNSIMRIPQFVRAWNDLNERSTTHKEDGLLILTNLLGFNVYSLARAPEKQRLPLLIKSCEELPLSILYNTGPRVQITGCPENGWVPLELEGCRLVAGALLRTGPQAENERYYRFDWDDCDSQALLVFMTLAESKIPYDVNVFSLFETTTGQEYYMKTQRPSAAAPEGLKQARDISNQSGGTVVIIDLATGSVSPHGFAGRGARFSVSSYSKKEMILRFDESLVAWTDKQWEFEHRNDESSVPFYNSSSVHEKQKVFLSFNPQRLAPKLTLLKRRSLFTQRQWGPHMIAAFVVVILGALIATPWELVRIVWRHPDLKLGVWVKLRAIGPWRPLCGALFYFVLYNTISRRLAMYKYRTWLETFDENWAQPRKVSWLRQAWRRVWALIALNVSWRRGQRHLDDDTHELDSEWPRYEDEPLLLSE